MEPYGLHAPTQGPRRFEGAGIEIGDVEVVGPLEQWEQRSEVALCGQLEPKSISADEARSILTRFLPQAFRHKLLGLTDAHVMYKLL